MRQPIEQLRNLGESGQFLEISKTGKRRLISHLDNVDKILVYLFSIRELKKESYSSNDLQKLVGLPRKPFDVAISQLIKEKLIESVFFFTNRGMSLGVVNYILTDNLEYPYKYKFTFTNKQHSMEKQDNFIAKEPEESKISIINEYRAKGKLQPGFFPVMTYDMVQMGYPHSDHGGMVAREFSGTDGEDRLMPGKGMWMKSEDVKQYIAQERTFSAIFEDTISDELWKLYDQYEQKNISLADMVDHIKALKDRTRQPLRRLTEMTIPEYQELFGPEFGIEYMQENISELFCLYALHELISEYGNFDTYRKIRNMGFDTEFVLDRKDINYKPSPRKEIPFETHSKRLLIGENLGGIVGGELGEMVIEMDKPTGPETMTSLINSFMHEVKEEEIWLEKTLIERFQEVGVKIVETDVDMDCCTFHECTKRSEPRGTGYRFTFQFQNAECLMFSENIGAFEILFSATKWHLTEWFTKSPFKHIQK